MKIKPKVIALVAGLFSILGAAQYLVEQHILLPSFAELERQAAEKDMDRVAHALNHELDLLAVTARDWSNWADTYAFMQDHGASYTAANLTDGAIASLRVNVIAFVALDGHYVWSIGRDLKSRQALDLDLLAHGALPGNHLWRATLHAGRETSGLFADQPRRDDRGLHPRS
jgi:sensor domain CHASE-containing protein